MATSGAKIEAKTAGEAEAKAEIGKCGECKKTVGRNDKAVECELCEMWFHCRCENVAEDTYKLMNQDKIHFYCGRCDKAAGKILKTVLGIQRKQEHMVEELDGVKKEVAELRKIPFVRQDQLDDKLKDIPEVKQLKTEWAEMKKAMTDKLSQQDKPVGVNEGDGVQKQVEDLTAAFLQDGSWTEVVKKRVTTEMTVGLQMVRVEIEENREIERRKGNIIMFGVPETDAEQDIDTVDNIFANGLHLDATRHVSKMMRLGRHLSADRPRPLRIELKTLESKKEILIRAKSLKETAAYKRMFIAPDLTKKQQAEDKELRRQLKEFRDKGESGVKIKSGKVVKNVAGHEEVLFQLGRT